MCEFFGLPPLFGRFLIGRRGFTVEVISPPVAADKLVRTGISLKPEEKKYPRTHGQDLILTPDVCSCIFLRFSLIYRTLWGFTGNWIQSLSYEDVTSEATKVGL